MSITTMQRGNPRGVTRRGLARMTNTRNRTQEAVPTNNNAEDEIVEEQFDSKY